MEGVLSLVWPNGDAKDFNLAGSENKKQVQEYQINAVHSKLKWIASSNL